MHSEQAGHAQHGGKQAFWWRLTDNLFRRIVLFLLPVVAMTLVGFVQARDILEVYEANATLSASTNPLVPDQPVGAQVQWFESPATSTSRIINEQLRTDSFLSAVAERAGLGDSVAAGLVGLDVVRRSVWAGEDGAAIFNVTARWADPQTSYQLVAATIEQYQDYLTETVASASTEAEDFYSKQLELFEAERDEADAALTSYVAGLPPLEPFDEYPVSVEIDTERLKAAVDTAQSKIEAARTNIEAAQLARAQQTNVAGRSFDVIDPPAVPAAPTSTVVQRLMTVASFALLGLVIAAAALLLTTVLDRSIASANDLIGIEGVSFVATVPPVRFATLGEPKRSRKVRRRASSDGDVR